MKNLSEEQEEKLKGAFSAICNLSFATIKDNHSRCGSFHLEPFNTHWDKKTTKDVMKNVKIYIDTWVIRPMEQAFLLDRRTIEKEARKWRKKEQERKKTFLAENRHKKLK